jgi:hypothetical protein
MQMLPVANISQITVPPEPEATSEANSKQKRKAAEDVGPKSHNKKVSTEKPSTSRPSTRRSGRTAHIAPTKDDAAMEQV